MSTIKSKFWSHKHEKLVIPQDYKSDLDLRETETAIKYIKDNFQTILAYKLNLSRVSAPISILKNTGMNDNLSGTEKPVGFTVSSLGEEAEIVQSLAKWKRNALADYGFKYGEGLYTDMNAIRPDEEFLDNLHSIYVDQWDWERVIKKDERSIENLRKIVQYIYSAIKEVETLIHQKYPGLSNYKLPEEIFFIHSEDLQKQYPELSPAERENAICKKQKAVFIIGIGAQLIDGKPHDDRASDYDDWSTETSKGYRGLNGDILVWYPVLDQAFELSSMGIRVDQDTLQNQLEMKNENYKKNLYFHQRVIKNELPLTIGGGIGQSRLCMFYLQKAFIGEVQAGNWSNDLRDICRENNIPVL